MDSRLLNAFHDDPFDGNYVKYDTDTQFWSNENGTMGLQLADTLHGILPIPPTEVVPNNLFHNSILKEGDYLLENKHSSNTNSIMHENYEDVTPIGIVNKIQLCSQQTIDIVSVDPNDDYDSEFLQSTDDDDEENKEDEETRGVVQFDGVRSCSRSTFRSRTDSSSIGDYESHSSDYDDESDAMELEPVYSNVSPSFRSKMVDDFALHSDANELKKTVEDGDPFAMQLDVSTFDLAAFITQDDQVFENNSSSEAANVAHTINFQEVVSANSSDSDSDVIVDVETVENEDIGVISWNHGKENEVEHSDNVEVDPPRTSCEQNVEKKETKQSEPNFSRNFTVIPNKRQTDFLKRKFGIGRGKNLNMHRNPQQVTPKSDLKHKPRQNKINSLNNNVVEEETKNSNIPTKVIVAAERTVENIVEKPLKQKTEKTNSGESLDKCTKSITERETVKIKSEPKEDNEKIETDVREESQIVSEVSENLPMKRKLNLEEYKKRRENPSVHLPIKRQNKNIQPSLNTGVPVVTQHTSRPHNIQNKKMKTEVSVQTRVPIVPQSSPKCKNNKPPQTEAVTLIVKNLKDSQCTKRFIDPITEAKNKVLRLQELKKAQQIKIIDSTVSSKVARVTKLLPLKDIVKGCYKTGSESHGISNSEYEEIIIVSTGCNTDLTIPPNGYSIDQQKVGKNSSRSLLKSNVLLANISNSFEKVRSDESVKISSSSLIVSIQDVVVKNSAHIPQEPIKVQGTSSLLSEHGEDKIIMHLRKDRIRKRNFSQSTQTDLLPEFPALPLPKLQTSTNRGRKTRRKYRVRHNSYSSDEETCNNRSQEKSSSRRSMSKHNRRHRSSISSSYSESDQFSKKTRRYSTSSSHSRGRSISSNEQRSSRKSFNRRYRDSRSRSKSSSRSRRREINRDVERNVSAPAVEERRIVYVGRIEQDTTKELLRQKFIAYGPIKQITIHYKDTGMKYGFVTYEKSEDAFRVIDSGQNDAKINMYDISFGGRRAFCRASYADLDNAGINTYQSYVVPRQVAPPKKEDSFEALLLKVKAKLNATKSSSPNLKT